MHIDTGTGASSRRKPGPSLFIEFLDSGLRRNDGMGMVAVRTKKLFAIFSLGARCHRTLSMNVKSTCVHENSDGSVGRESAVPPAGPFYGATRRTTQRPSNNRGGGCAAGENDRREALRFPALRNRRCFHAHRSTSRSWRACDALGKRGAPVPLLTSAMTLQPLLRGWCPALPAGSEGRGQRTENLFTIFSGSAARPSHLWRRWHRGDFPGARVFGPWALARNRWRSP
jgi:hypothetical protein